MIQGLHYLDPVLDALAAQWPNNRTINIVFHGHSVPSGYFATPYVNTFDAYPHLLHRMIKERFPFAVVNIIVTAIGGEYAAQGAKRFDAEVLNHNPDVLILDYGLNDRFSGLKAAAEAWEEMIQKALSRGIKVILCTPTWDTTYYEQNDSWESLRQHAEQIRTLADKYNVGLADSYEAFHRFVKAPEDLTCLLSFINHPSKAGHQLVANEISKYFIAHWKA